MDGVEITDTQFGRDLPDANRGYLEVAAGDLRIGSGEGEGVSSDREDNRDIWVRFQGNRVMRPQAVTSATAG